MMTASASTPETISVTDDSGIVVKLDQPATRIISLAPHITELLYSAGAGHVLVGTVEFSDYPPAAQQLPRIGRHDAFDVERILSLRPDLVIAWLSGTPKHQLRLLKEMGLKIYYSEPRKLEDIAHNIRQFGKLTGASKSSETAADKFMQDYRRLRQQYQGRTPITVYYQTWGRPLMTLNGQHMVNEVIELCGGVNVFAGLPVLSPVVSKESVIAADPEVIIATSINNEMPDGLKQWRQWPSIRAVKSGNLFFIHPDIIHRDTVRILEGARSMCGLLDQARARQTP